MMPIKIAPSLLAADFARLGDEIQKVEAGGADLLHLDVMDGHFVPNLTVGPLIVEWIRKVTSLPLDCHLMIMEPEKYVDAFADAGADSITFHAEAVAREAARRRKEHGYVMQLICQDFYERSRLDETIDRIRAKGKRVGIAVNPDTEAECIVDILPRIDRVLTMTVWPGFGGQKFIERVLPKVRKLRAMAPMMDIQVDGGVNLETVGPLAEAGANVMVAGTATFRSTDVSKAIRGLRTTAEKARGNA